MNCLKCGNQLGGNEEFCPKCGFNLIENSVSTTDQVMQKGRIIVLPFVSKIKHYIWKYRKIELIFFSTIFLFLMGIFTWHRIKNIILFDWDKNYKDFKLEYVTQTTVKLGVVLDEKEAEKIKSQSTCGTVTINGLELLWDLKGTTGKCQIIVSYKSKKINKEYQILPNNVREQELALDYEIDLESEEDLDLDGLTNKQEKEYGTNPLLSDSDMDGLDDYYEILISKTDPNKIDTDDDGLSDYDEIELGLDPLKSDSKGDGVKDGDRKNTYITKSEKTGIIIEIIGTGNVASTTVSTFDNQTFANMNGVLDTVYNFYTKGTIGQAVVKIPYHMEELKRKNLKEEDLSLYYFNEETKELENISTIIDKENHLLIATLSHFSKYVVADRNVVLTNTKTNVMFVIDNSVSMYSEAQMIQAGYKESVGAIGNDIFFKRLTLTSKMIDMFTGNYKFGVAEFSGNYVRLNKFTDSALTAKKSVSSMKNNWNSNAIGTNIVEALNSSIKEFNVAEDKNYIILLTDGKNTEGSLSRNRNSIIMNAKNKNIKVCVIGLGTSIDTADLSEIATQTGCHYYSANDSNALDEIYSIIGSDINYNFIDVDNDGKVDGMKIADSGFLVTRDGFSFENYGTNLSKGGHCYGMATFAQLYYKQALPLKVNSIDTGKSKSYAYDLSNTYFKNYANLYDYKLKTNELKYTFGFEAFDEETPSDFRTLNGKVYAINEPYRTEIINSNLYNIEETKSSLSKKQQLEKYGINYKSAENIYLDEDKMQGSKTIKNDDIQILNAIYAAFIRQDITTHYASSSDFTLWMRNIIGTESSDKIDSAGFIELLKKRLEDGDAPVIFSNFNGGFHAINAISLVQDNKDFNHYYIGVYDNNYPGEKRYVDIECTKKTCVTKANNYYSNSKQPIRITASLEYDLEYYQKGKVK